MKAVRIACALFVVAACTALIQTVVAGQASRVRTFDRVQYLGGMVGFRGTSPRWDNTLTISATSIAMRNKESILLFELSPAQLRSLQYLQYGRTEPWYHGLIPLVPLVTLPIATIDVLVPEHQARHGNHFIAVEYFFADCQVGALLLRVDKKNYKDVIAALTETRTPAEVERAPVPHACLQKPDDTTRGSDSQKVFPADIR